MKENTLWIYGDSYAQDSEQAGCWAQVLQQLQESSRLEVHGLAGAGNDWIFRQILDTAAQWQPEDRVVVVWIDRKSVV